MKAETLICELKPYIQPFEKLLAIEELKKLSAAEQIEQNDLQNKTIYKVSTSTSIEFLAKRLTYWERVKNENDVLPIVTKQVKYEATADALKLPNQLKDLRNVLLSNLNLVIPKRRSLRYGTHGIHEYRGKFFPQLVKSLLNIAKANSESIVLDPMCGSGTTVVESALIGSKQSIGLDINPLSVLISQAKTEMLSVPSELLLKDFKLLINTISEIKAGLVENETPWSSNLSESDKQYLNKWFAPSVLNKLDQIMLAIGKINTPACQKLFRVSLSNIIRRVSWQVSDDLRVRKKKVLEIFEDPFTLYEAEAFNSVKSILPFLLEKGEHLVGKSSIIELDARKSDKIIDNLESKVDIIITSPPYATALPYLDTDRLSLCYLGLLNRKQHRLRDVFMIGNREISEKQKRSYLQAYNTSSLPSEITSLIDKIHNLNSNSNVGFRRRNVSALLAKYFLDMQIVFRMFRSILKQDGYAFVIIGNNHTIAGNQKIEIETDKLIGQLGKFEGLTLEQSIPMEMLVSRDIFRKNASNSETILCFRN